ncbi:hypothetical protein [Myxosarcina sp. GI1(2024)]
MEFLTNSIALSFVDKLSQETSRYQDIGKDAYDVHTTLKYIFARAEDVQIYLTANELITCGTRNPRLVYSVTVYNHIAGELLETYTTYELSIALSLIKTEFLAALDNYYTLKDE